MTEISNRSDEFETIREIADAICDGNPQDEQLVELAVLLENNPAGQRFYLEYMDMNGRLLMQADESKSLSINSFVPHEERREEKIIDAEVLPPSKNYTKVWLLLITLILLTSALIIWLVSQQKPDDNFATVVYAEGVTDSSGKRLAAEAIIGSKEYSIKTGLEFITNNGSHITIKNGKIQFKKENELHLDGSYLSIKTQEPFLLHFPPFHLSSDKAVYKVIKNENSYDIEVVEGELVIEPNVWQPIHYWPLDEITDSTSDMGLGSDGIVIGEVTPEKGIIGKGAARFTNIQGQNIMVRIIARKHTPMPRRFMTPRWTS